MAVTIKDVAVPSEYEKGQKEERLADFGFSIAEDDKPVIDSVPNSDEKIIKLKEKLEFIKDLFFTLLDNLAQHPEVDTIKWPNRLAKITTIRNQVMKKLKE